MGAGSVTARSCVCCGAAAGSDNYCPDCRPALERYWALVSRVDFLREPRDYVTPPHVEERIAVYSRRAALGLSLFDPGGV